MKALKQRDALALSERSARELNAILELDAHALSEIRSNAASRILADMPRLGDKAGSRNGRRLLAQVRYGRHGF